MRRSGRATGVTVMEPTDLWELNDVAHPWWFDCSRHGTILVEREVGPRLVVIGEVASQNASQVYRSTESMWRSSS